MVIFANEKEQQTDEQKDKDGLDIEHRHDGGYSLRSGLLAGKPVQYAIGLNIEKLKTECTKAVEQEELYRFYLSERDSVETPKTHIYIKVNIDNRKGNSKSVKKKVSSK